MAAEIDPEVGAALDAVVNAAATGDPAALQTIYETLAPRVLGFVGLRGAADPEALTQDVFIRVLPRVSTLSGGWSGLRALAFTVAHGLVVDELRARERQPRLHPYDVQLDRRTTVSAETTAMGQIGSEGVLDVLDLLPEDQKTVFVMRVLGELTVSEVSAAIGRSEVAVRKVQAKAVQRLRELLSSPDDEMWTGGTA